MATKIVATYKRTGAKYVTCNKAKNGFYRVQTLRAKQGRSYWFIAKKNLIIK